LRREVEEPSLFGIGLNRIVAFGGPYLAALAGVVATWLTAHVHLFATFHVGNNDLADAIAQATVFGVTTLVVWLGQHKWLDGFQKWAYGVYEDISHVELPESYHTPTPPTTEAIQGFENDPARPGQPPVSE